MGVKGVVAGIARKLAISVFSLLVVLVLAELVARFAEPGPMSLFDKNPYERPKELVELPGGGTRTLRFNDHKKSFTGRWDGTWYEINARGWRGPEYEPDFSEDEFRVLALGDSCTFGKGVDEKDSWPRQLEARLGKLMPEREVLVGNLGVNGYSSLHYRRILSKALETRPHLVVLGYNVNDFPNITLEVDKAIYHNKRNLRSRIPGHVRETLGSTALYRFLRATYYELKEKRDRERMERIAETATQGYGTDSERWKMEVEILRSMVTDVRDTGAEMAIFLFPFENMVYLDEYTTGPVETVRKLCEELEVPFIDMVAEFREYAHQEDPPRELFIRGDRYHPNPEGYRVVARAVIEAFEGLGWLELAADPLSQ